MAARPAAASSNNGLTRWSWLFGGEFGIEWATEWIVSCASFTVKRGRFGTSGLSFRLDFGERNARRCLEASGSTRVGRAPVGTFLRLAGGRPLRARMGARRQGNTL